MTKKKVTISLTPESRAALEALFTALGWTGQQGKSLNAGFERLGQLAADDMDGVKSALEWVALNDCGTAEAVILDERRGLFEKLAESDTGD
jgi:hypothetical protein